MKYIKRFFRFYGSLHIVDKICSILTVLLLMFIVRYFSTIELLLFYYIFGVALPFIFPYLLIIVIILAAFLTFQWIRHNW